MKKALILIFVLFNVAAAPAQAVPDKKALEGLEVLRRGFAELTDFTAEITQEKQLALMKQKMVSRGVIRFRKPGTFYMELYPPNGSLLLMRDNVLTIRLPEQGMTDRMVLPPEQSLEKWMAFLSRPITTLPEGMEVKGVRQGDNWTVHILPAGTGGVKELQITFDLEGRIRRLTIEERNRDRTVIRFTSMRRNVGLKEKDFQLN
ncbi:LolA family protein [Geomobilimonas luticola]|uniref:Outer membrane lipoprotein carrier protein LolA n=1 Tax=Geomobilimonas luticola TaxID=1114878 RepID=A0ABS5SAJ4_9BACT|nr:outer membrane lipoprotein carrier protein LolA [Geomobilimonas luticola]MBT0652393.1 outer membrane lipoprotein carrier protein LolA [Geomobilimonas luticola]